MKKVMVVAVMTAMVLSSCSKQETVNDATATRGAIGFESFVGKPTKALEIGSWKSGDEMRVTGYATDGPMQVGVDLQDVEAIKNLTNRKVIYNGTSWSYTPAAYWVDQKHHTFFAAAPTNTPSMVSIEAGKATITVNPLVDKQVDILLANPVRIPDAYVLGSKPAPVIFTMRHVLSQILFRAKIAVDDTSVSNVRITSLTVAPKSGEFAEVGKVDLVGKVDADGPNTVVVQPHPEPVASYTLTPAVAVVVNKDGYSAIKHQTDHVAMLLPQNVPVFVVTAKVIYTMGGVDQPEQEITFDAGAITWEPNLRYAYSLNIDVPVQILKKEPIKIGNPTIIEWGATTDVDLDDGIISGEVIDPDVDPN